ncbi:peptide chain release factor 2 [Ilyobacter polytropus]|uniref:Peptide chain release factor 2 n=1 Tax=Ilyobacter polytropus (strain ATCC 51220 / DSM 2926 / LMG 16218 / CuHBu1) TaxID=572544 RepID=E3HAY8_ILYPC|nr:peptide chain release factor 2 [Ilyobacter polytropus]ADO82137.1 bacterial peptide chain release factor 2 (bRF-2) [Ilyobacter polytropus DSM 2926]
MDILELKREHSQHIEKIEEIRGSLDLEGKENKVKELEKETLKDGFWNDKRESEKLIKEMNALKEIIGEYRSIEKLSDEVSVLLEFVEMGEDEFLEELETKHRGLDKVIGAFDVKLLLDGEFDANNAIVTIHSGAGGTEACDWADMLYRMYSRWCNNRGYKITELDFMPGEMVGIKSITILVEGMRAYGYLKNEKGIHRLVRISPFDANKKRHTSFASVDVMPEVDETTDIEINTGDLKIDTYRASGAGGQHVNTTDSAVRITHLPSGVVVTCQRERSQLQNRETAMKLLRSKLLELEMKKREEELKKIQGEQSDIGWGSQIRSYVFQPYTLVKDHRTLVESGNIKAVMDGDIDDFINGHLRWLKR